VRAAVLVAVAFGIGVVWGGSGAVRGMVRSATVTQTPRVFSAETGMLLDYVKAGQTDAFEGAMTRVGVALTSSAAADRRRQAVGWKIYKAAELLPGDVVLYVSVLEPVVTGADYWVPQILNEAFPTEVQTLYETYAGAFADGQMLLNLIPVSGL